MAKNEKTSPRVLKIAGKGLPNPSKLTKKQIKSVLASALSQGADKKTAKKRK